MSKKSEFERLIAGEKPMAAYYKAVGEDFFYSDRDKFQTASDDGILIKQRFFIKNKAQAFKLFYEVYSNSENVWRLHIYHLLKRIGQNFWNADLEEIEGIILGYRRMP